MSQSLPVTWVTWVYWALAFLGFPLGGLLASLLVGPVLTPVRGLLAGLITGAALGLVQWLVLRSIWNVPATWILATSLGLGVGLALGVSAFGTETTGNVLLWRALLTGAAVGLAQWLVFQAVIPNAWLWPVIIALVWPLSWWITRSAGVDLTFHWSVFGSTGAWAFQLATGLTLLVLVRLIPVK